MGAITTLATFAGGITAGTGAAIITERVVNEIGFKCTSTKLGKFCVSMCALTLGNAAFDKVNDMFTEQAIEFLETVDKIKESRKEFKKEPEKKAVDRDAAISDAEQLLKQADETLKSMEKVA